MRKPSLALFFAGWGLLAISMTGLGIASLSAVNHYEHRALIEQESRVHIAGRSW